MFWFEQCFWHHVLSKITTVKRVASFDNKTWFSFFYIIIVGLEIQMITFPLQAVRQASFFLSLKRINAGIGIRTPHGRPLRSTRRRSILTMSWLLRVCMIVSLLIYIVQHAWCLLKIFWINRNIQNSMLTVRQSNKLTIVKRHGEIFVMMTKYP